MIRQHTTAGHGQRTDCTLLSMIPYIGRKYRICISPGTKKYKNWHFFVYMAKIANEQCSYSGRVPYSLYA